MTAPIHLSRFLLFAIGIAATGGGAIAAAPQETRSYARGDTWACVLCAAGLQRRRARSACALGSLVCRECSLSIHGSACASAYSAKPCVPHTSFHQ